jgi:transposase
MFQQIHKRKWKQRKRPEILPLRAQKRLAWAIRYQNYTPRDWQRILWSDECTIERGKGGQTIWTWHMLTEQLTEHDVREIRTGKSVSKMFWAGFKYDQRSQLIPLTSDGSSAGGGITATVIQQLYMEQLPELLADGEIFMQDNAPVHRAYIIRNLLQELGLNTMEWPPYSPDLNPIENLWAIVKTIIFNDYPELRNAPDNDSTLSQLIQAAKEAWNSIEPRVFQNLSNTMPNRVRAVIEANGWYTKY